MKRCMSCKQIKADGAFAANRSTCRACAKTLWYDVRLDECVAVAIQKSPNWPLISKLVRAGGLVKFPASIELHLGVSHETNIQVRVRQGN